jgi:hypothetical protein
MCPSLADFEGLDSNAWPHLHSVAELDSVNEFWSNVAGFPEITFRRLEICLDIAQGVQDFLKYVAEIFKFRFRFQ